MAEKVVMYAEVKWVLVEPDEDVVAERVGRLIVGYGISW